MGDFPSSVTNTIWGGDPVIVVREQSTGYTAEWNTVCSDYSRFEIHYTKDTANLGYSMKGIHLAWDRVFRGYNRPGIRYTQDAGGLAYSIQMTLQAWDIVFLDSEKKFFTLVDCCNPVNLVISGSYLREQCRARDSCRRRLVVTVEFL